jgi:hypothetical protein
MKSLKILIPAFVVLLSACGTSQVMQSSANSGDDVYYSSSAQPQQSPVYTNEVAQPVAPAQQPVETQQYTTDSDNGQIVTSSGDNTQDLNRSSDNYPQTTTEDSAGNTYITNNYYGSGSPYPSRNGYDGYGNNYGNYGYGGGFGGYNSFGFSPDFSLSLGLGFGSAFYPGFSSFYNPFYSPFGYPGYYSPYGYGYGLGYGYYNPYSYYNNFYGGNDYYSGSGTGGTYAQNYTGIRTSPGTNTPVHVAHGPIQSSNGHIINNGTVIRPRENANVVKSINNNGAGINQSNRNPIVRPNIQFQNNNQPQPRQQDMIQQVRPAVAPSIGVPHQSAQVRTEQLKNEKFQAGAFMDRMARQNNLGGKQRHQSNSENSNKSFSWGGSRSSSSSGSGSSRRPHL